MPQVSTSAISKGRNADIARRLEDEIVQGLHPPGQRLDERALAQRFGVSRTPIREALQILAATGLAETRARSGAYVARISLSTVFQMFEFMAELEAACARHAANRMTRDQKRELREVASFCEEQAGIDTDAYAAANFSFHDLIYRGSGNPFLEGQARQTRQRVAAYRRYMLNLPGRIDNSLREHFEIVEAIEAGDGERARDIMLLHIDIRREDYTPFIVMMSQAEAG